MGGGESHEDHHHHHYHTTTVYQTPPEVEKELTDTKEALKVFETEAIDRGDPNLYKENANKLLDGFIEKLPQLNLVDLIVKETGENHIGFMGPISAGKTTMINTLFGLNLPVALGHCTTTCDVVHTQDNMCFWDVPGSQDDYRFYKAENLSFVKSLDKAVLLYDNDIDMISNILRVVNKIIPDNIILVRTKVDQHNEKNVRTIAEEKEIDQRKIKELLGVELNVYCVSSFNIINDGNSYDWEQLKTAIGL
jgi:small GTP-binding protein